MARKFVDEFTYPEEKEQIEASNDYDAFPDKVLLEKLRNEIIQSLIDNNLQNHEKLDDYVKSQIDKITSLYDLNSSQMNYIYNLIDNEINGYGPLTELLKDKDITEIMVNGPDEIYIELDGHIIRDESVSFVNDDHIVRVVQRMVQPLGRNIDIAHPMVDARLEDGSRLNAILPPLSLNGPVVTIRKFKRELADIEDFLRSGTMTPYMARFLEAAVEAKLNILIVGGTGSGKTTLLNVLSSFCKSDERIITIEDAAELKLKQKHVISLETRTKSYEGKGSVTIRDLVINSLRMRPDRIIVGEVRGKEAFDMLQAMNTGHEGSMTTLHANGRKDALNRLETMVLMNGVEIPVTAIREYVESAIDIIVQTQRFSDGKRRVSSISEITGMKDGEILQREIFKYKQTGVSDTGSVLGEFLMYKRIPRVYSKIKTKGITTLDGMFE